jgi:thiamine kinase-like enzyme
VKAKDFVRWIEDNVDEDAEVFLHLDSWTMNLLETDRMVIDKDGDLVIYA